jgi:hypothetical protein
VRAGLVENLLDGCSQDSNSMSKFAMAMESVGVLELRHVSFCEVESLLNEDTAPDCVVVVIKYSVDLRVGSFKMLSCH